MNYVNLCLVTAREEILFRINLRSKYLILQLLVLAIIFALVQKITILGTIPSESTIALLLLVSPISVVFLFLYHVEDKLVVSLSMYCAELPPGIDTLENGEKIQINNWNRSKQFSDYCRNVNLSRFITQLLVFVIIPILVVTYSLVFLETHGNTISTSLNLVIISSLIALFFLGCCKLYSGYNLRRKIRNKQNSTIQIVHPNRDAS